MINRDMKNFRAPVSTTMFWIVAGSILSALVMVVVIAAHGNEAHAARLDQLKNACEVK